MAQVLQKSYDCLTCHKQIRIAKIDNVPPGQKKKREKYELDGVTLHVCPKQQPEQSAAKEEPEKQQPRIVSNDLSTEVAAIKAQLLELVSRLDRIK
jgi:uncharacterized protein YceH (UPF0502 family)